MTPDEYIALNGLKVADESTPEYLISHGRPPGDDHGDVAICGAPFVVLAETGRQDNGYVFCKKCLDAAYEAGIID